MVKYPAWSGSPPTGLAVDGGGGNKYFNNVGCVGVNLASICSHSTSLYVSHSSHDFRTNYKWEVR
ncbi:hypothetical protein LINGRAHAP2_LOCUS4815 [Linum grandiflorum]